MQTATSPDAPQGVRQVAIGPERDGQRIDNALMTLLKGVPKSMIYRLLRTGQVRVNGKRAKPDTRLAAGDTLRIPPVRTAEKAGLTLVALVRGDDFEIFTHPDRIKVGAAADVA